MLAAVGVLVFVDVTKELPATLVMRPFNFDTLAAQAIIVVGLLPLIALSRQISAARRPWFRGAHSVFWGACQAMGGTSFSSRKSRSADRVLVSVPKISRVSLSFALSFSVL